MILYNKIKYCRKPSVAQGVLRILKETVSAFSRWEAVYHFVLLMVTVREPSLPSEMYTYLPSLPYTSKSQLFKTHSATFLLQVCMLCHVHQTPHQETTNILA